MWGRGWFCRRIKQGIVLMVNRGCVLSACCGRKGYDGTWYDRQVVCFDLQTVSVR